MGNKIFNGKRIVLIFSSGVILGAGVNKYREFEVKKLCDRLYYIDLNRVSFGVKYPILNSVYSELVFNTRNVNSIYNEYIMGDFNYKVRNYIPSLSSDFVSYTFYDDYILIKLYDNGNIYGDCCYHDDGSYSISCICDYDIDSLDSNEYITYNFSSDGILTDSSIGDYKFEYIGGNINDYSIVSKSNTYKKK